MQAQQGYYSLASANAALPGRLEALKAAIPIGLHLLDLGCNDGTIAKELLKHGTANKVTGYDLEDLVGSPVRGLTVVAANLLTLQLSSLPNADGVLLLNVLHHIFAANEARAMEMLNYLLARYEFVIIDLGSLTERGEWPWLKTLRERFRDDKELWDFLFERAALRFKLHRYPAQGGNRVIWKLYGAAYPLGQLVLVQDYRRTIGSWHDNKKLVEASQSIQDPVAPSVRYELLRSQKCDLFFRKTYMGESHPKLAFLEFELSKLARAALEGLSSYGVEEHRFIRICAPVHYADNSLLSIFEPDLFESKPIHHQDWSVIFDSHDARVANIIACAEVQLGSLPLSQLLFLSDFQVAKGWDGLSMLDFEPNSVILSVPIEFWPSDEQRGAAFAKERGPFAGTVITDIVEGKQVAHQDLTTATSQPNFLPGRLISPLELITYPRNTAEALIRERVRPFRLDGSRAIATMLGRFKIFVDVGDLGFGTHILADGYWEMWLTEFMIQTLRPGMQVLDVGANFGYYTLLMSELVGHTGRVAAFEPNPQVAEQLTASVSVNGFKHRTDVIRAAVSSAGGSATFFVPYGEPKNGQIVPKGYTRAHGETFEVTIVALDDVVSIDRKVDFVKIDAEGAEFDILRGMERLLKRDRPKMIVEFNAARGDARGLLALIHTIYDGIACLNFNGEIQSVGDDELMSVNLGQDWLLYLSA